MATATLVTSTVAKAGPDGVIPIHMAGWLIPHGTFDGRFATAARLPSRWQMQNADQ